MATIVMKAWQVIQACETTIAKIEAERLARDEKEIAIVMDTKYGWFKKYYPTREQAINILKEAAPFLGWRSCYAHGDLALAKKLLKLANRGDPVTLNENDVEAIF